MVIDKLSLEETITAHLRQEDGENIEIIADLVLASMIMHDFAVYCREDLIDSRLGVILGFAYGSATQMAECWRIIPQHPDSSLDVTDCDHLHQTIIQVLRQKAGVETQTKWKPTGEAIPDTLTEWLTTGWSKGMIQRYAIEEERLKQGQIVHFFTRELTGTEEGRKLLPA